VGVSTGGRFPQESIAMKQDASKADAAMPTVASTLTDDQNRILEELTDNFKFATLFPLPENIADLEAIVLETQKDLSAVPVLGVDGSITDACTHLKDDERLSADQKKLIWQCLALVRSHFARSDRSALKNNRSHQYQWEMNWKHTRAEVNQVAEAARLLKLSGEETRDALIASIFSDSVKTRTNFLYHNIHGAQAAAAVLSRLMPLDSADTWVSIERITRAIKEHQIAPPDFMGKVAAVQICHAVGLAPELLETGLGPAASLSTHRTIRHIREKIANPFNKYHLNNDLDRVLFTPEERTLLRLVGIEEWFVPHPENENSKIAHAVIAGDHSINYNHPEGFAKIALLRGPDTEQLFEDPTIFDSLDSAVSSFADSYKVLRAEVQPLAVAGLRRTKIAVERITAIMRELFNGVAYGATSKDQMGRYTITKAFERAQGKQPQLFNANLQKLSQAGHEYIQQAVERVIDILQEWFDTAGDIPFDSAMERQATQGYAQLPFWNSPLKYPPRDNFGMAMVARLSPLEQKQFAFAERIREIAVELLRAEEWIF
jgi:hypothetical protein